MRMRVCMWAAVFALIGGIWAGGAEGQATQANPPAAQSGQSAPNNQTAAPAQSTRQTRTPSRESLYDAHKACQELFSNLSTGNTEEAARWISSELGYAQDDDGRQSMMENFRNKFDALLVTPPASPYGKLSGYDLIDESYLPNSTRYFRLIYMTYHEGAPLLWEFRFYVRPEGHVALENVEWSEKIRLSICRRRTSCTQRSCRRSRESATVSGGTGNPACVSAPAAGTVALSPAPRKPPASVSSWHSRFGHRQDCLCHLNCRRRRTSKIACAT